MGIIAARQISAILEKRKVSTPSPDTMMGALLKYITKSDSNTFQPMNANFGLLVPPEKNMSKTERKSWYAERALKKAADFF